MRTETSQQGITSVTLIDQDAKTAYVYMPAQNTAMKSTYVQATQEAGYIADYKVKDLGTESIDGKTCLVSEFTYGQATTKMWIWKDRGLPLKMEFTAPEGKYTMEYKNYDFSDIPDSMFELPAGVNIIPSGQQPGR